jgi:uncharacterized protein YecT (DUF1311 family)
MKYLVTVLIAVVAAQSSAASFDCNSADVVRDIDRFICNDPEISALDEKMGMLYQENYRKLSPTSRVAYLNSQRSWLNYWPGACLRESDEKDTLESAKANNCVKQEYERRIEQLSVLTNHQSWQIYKVSKSALTKAKKGDVRDGVRFTQHQLNYPQIEGQHLSEKDQREIKKINGWITQSIRQVGLKNRVNFNEDYMDSFLFSSLDDPAPDVQTLKTILYTYGFGAHGNTVLANYHYMISENRNLVAEDFFEGNWKNMIAEQSFAQLKAKLQSNFFVQTVSDLSQSTQRTSNWRFYREGLQISFNQYEVGPYSEGSPEVLIPWVKLQNYLTPYGKSQIALMQDNKLPR